MVKIEEKADEEIDDSNLDKEGYDQWDYDDEEDISVDNSKTLHINLNGNTITDTYIKMYTNSRKYNFDEDGEEIGGDDFNLNYCSGMIRKLIKGLLRSLKHIKRKC